MGWREGERDRQSEEVTCAFYLWGRVVGYVMCVFHSGFFDFQGKRKRKRKSGVTCVFHL